MRNRVSYSYKIVPFIILTICFFQAKSYDAIFSNNKLYDLYAQGVFEANNYNYTKTEDIIQQIKTTYGNHPTIFALEATILYWKGFPVTPNSPEHEEYEEILHTMLELIDEIKDEYPKDACYFGLMSRAMLMAYYADNGTPSRAISHITPVYKIVLNVMDNYAEDADFMFATGLYNYYRAAYAEAHPFFKPFLSFLREGNKQEGLNLLNTASLLSNLAKAEANYFSSMIYLNFEQNEASSLKFAEMLHKLFPNNAFYTGNYIKLLLLNKDYATTKKMMAVLKDQINGQKFYAMQYVIYNGLLYEKVYNQPTKALDMYNKAIIVADAIGEYANQYKSYAYFSKARIQKQEGKTKEAEDNLKKAKDHSSYDHVTFD